MAVSKNNTEKARLQKVLSQAGLGSRREMEAWIEAGVVEVNGKVAKIGSSVAAADKLKVRGKVVQNPLRMPAKTRILIYHKPIGEIASRRDPKHNKTVFDNLPGLSKGRWIQVGRLDINTSGLMIFTNDGTLANELMHPKYQFEREYAVRIYGDVTPDMLKQLKKGVTLEDGPAAFNTVVAQGGGMTNAWYHVTLSEGRNREVRRLFAAVGVEVSRLIRIRYGTLTLPRFLSRGQHMELSSEAVQTFLKSSLEQVNHAAKSSK